MALLTTGSNVYSGGLQIEALTMTTRQTRLVLLFAILVLAICAVGFFAHVPAQVFWPYSAAMVALVWGGFAVKDEIVGTEWSNRLLTLGPVFFAVPLAGFAAEHFVFTDAMVPMIPGWLPWRPFWLYLTGTALVAAAISILLKRNIGLSGILLGIMISSFVVILYLPKVIASPHDRFAWAVAVRDFCFAMAAFTLAATRAARPSLLIKVTLIAGLIVGVVLVFFSVEHFLHPEFAPGVPLRKITPTFIPFRLLWGYLTGLVLAAGGLSLLIHWRSGFVASALGLVYLVLVVFLYLPVMLVSWTNSGPRIEGLNFFLDTLMFGGVLLILSGARRVCSRNSQPARDPLSHTEPLGKQVAQTP